MWVRKKMSRKKRKKSVKGVGEKNGKYGRQVKIGVGKKKKVGKVKDGKTRGNRI